jgi:hypothetical protein
VSLLREIQAAVIEPDSKVGMLRLLASRLGSHPLEEWVKHESEGYPKGIPVPEYRKLGASYTGTFTDGVRTMNNAPIPTHLIEKFAGKAWTEYEIRASVAAVEDVASDQEGGGILESMPPI